jgi:hypothetical protein
LASIMPIACPRGTHRSTTSAQCAHDGSSPPGTNCCTACPGGSRCPYTGMINPLDCGGGYYSPEGSQECYPCREGRTCSSTTNGISLDTYRSGTGETAGQTGYIKTDGEYSFSDCPLGHYCPSGSRYPIPCPRGKVRDTVGGQTLSDCVDLTTVGRYADVTGSYTSIVADNICSPGYKCPAGATSKFAEPCPPGQYQDQPGQATCNLCPPGSFC